MPTKIRVTVWNEFYHEQHLDMVKEVYPEGIHRALANYLEKVEELEVSTATLYDPEHGLPDLVIEQTDVLIWWAHMKHEEVPDELTDKLYRRVIEGMGVIFLHSASGSKLFKRLMGTSGGGKWREAHERERLWVLKPGHPIVDGIGEYIELPNEEMYGDPSNIPEPDELIFMSWFEGGEIMRSGNVYTRGRGKIFYFRPGHEEYPTYYNKDVLKVIENAARWAAPSITPPTVTTGNVRSIEPIKGYIRDGMGNPIKQE
ncbi:ThuA domain-containing protein [Paenibacillus sp. FSL H7-0331]|uniref:ThuA domain-containing protein n=1 Tax=Paenibacillus sp. FSL H7-0331 TaxID=1920421 RepID=UPI00096ED161|nr:ThuA domain-containing protein [Paenibacillus sp. FSL H7-0331]OMF03578.1 trehalose utilization protein ThuA [Paenibacillus sp. FSL H7-0331]